MTRPNPARDPEGTLPGGAVASQRSEGLDEQRGLLPCACTLDSECVGCAMSRASWELWVAQQQKVPRPCTCGALEVKRASVDLWVCGCGRARLVEDMDVGSDVPGGGAA
jgi:hypothetical protein